MFGFPKGQIMFYLNKGRSTAVPLVSEGASGRVPSPHLLPRWRRMTSDAFWVTLPFVALLVIWQGAVTFWNIPPQVFPSIGAVVAKLIEVVHSGQVLTDMNASLGRIAIGATIAVLSGIPFGILMGTIRPLSEFFSPLLRFSVGISGIAWVPLATLWLGYGPFVCIFIIWNSVFFAIVYSTMLGVSTINRDLIRAARAAGAGPFRTFFEVFLPGSLPAIMTGLRSGLGYGWRGLIAAEMIATNAGFGYSIFIAQKYYDTAEIVMIMIILGILWLTIDRVLLGPLERRTIKRWGMTGGTDP